MIGHWRTQPVQPLAAYHAPPQPWPLVMALLVLSLTAGLLAVLLVRHLLAL